MEEKDLWGRQLTAQQINEENRAQAQVRPREKQFCVRCGTDYDKENRLPNGAFYCRECIAMGRLRSDEDLYAFAQRAFPPQHVLKWQGRLTQWQETISEQLRQAVAHCQSTLVYAVTGAGKTEIIYQTVADVIARGGAVCIATPRIDVCVELHRRMTQDFACPIALLYGEGENYQRTPLVIATTHQLLKFYKAFDLVIIDEVDAFPFVNNPVLHYGAQQALSDTGVQVYLTATSTPDLDKNVRNGSLKRLSLPRRFHNHRLIEPQIIWLSSVATALKKEKIPAKLIRLLRAQRKTGYPLLLFVPEIQVGQQLKPVLQQLFPAEKIENVSSQTENRAEIIEDFRNQAITILITTTILERGVTFPGVDVFVLDADHSLYHESTLVQISGRVGRSLERPTGLLYYLSPGRTRQMVAAARKIKRTNKEAGFD